MLAVTNDKDVISAKSFPKWLNRRMNMLKVIFLSTFQYFVFVFRSKKLRSICATGIRSKRGDNQSNLLQNKTNELRQQKRSLVTDL